MSLRSGQYDDLFGVIPDAEIARLAGVSGSAASARRRKLGIEAVKPASAVEQYIDQLGVLTDTEIAEQSGLSIQTVAEYRQRMGIDRSPNRKPRHDRWTAGEIGLFAVLDDDEIAQQIGRTLAAVQRKRAKLGVPRPLRTCQECGRPYHAWGTSIYCSVECSSAAQAKCAAENQRELQRRRKTARFRREAEEVHGQIKKRHDHEQH